MMTKKILLSLSLIFCVSTAFGQVKPQDKLSSHLRTMLLPSNNYVFEPQTRSFQGSKTQVLVFVKTTSDIQAFTDSLGIRTLANFGDIKIMSVPQQNILTLARDERVIRIEASQRNDVQNATSAQLIGADKVHSVQQLPQAYTGNGVVVGVMDVGFDLTVPNFYSSDMSQYRIKRLWDMLGEATATDTIAVGRELTTQQALLSYARTRDSELTNHGSHTLGSAAGSGYGSQYRGMAPDADICLVGNYVGSLRSLVTDEQRLLYTSALDALGFKYMFDYAESVGKPCVISFSEGAYTDFSEEDLLYEEVLNSLIGPGKIIVASAGNLNGELTYINKPVGQESAGTFLRRDSGSVGFVAKGSDDFEARFVMYGASNQTLSVNTEWLRQQTDGEHRDTVSIAGTRYAFAFYGSTSAYDENEAVLTCAVTNVDGGAVGVAVPLSVEFIGTGKLVEAYKVAGSFVNNALNASLCSAEQSHNIMLPGAFRNIICVGATVGSHGYVNLAGNTMNYVNGELGKIADFSSVGPNAFGETKPNVVAPGTNVISSTNSYYFEANPTSRQVSDFVASYEHGGRTHYWKADTGTSMSTPLVAGTIALWLQARPNLSPADVMALLASTSTHPDESLSYPNNTYGYGQIDAHRGLLSLLNIDGIEEIEMNSAQNVQFDVREGGILSVLFPSPLEESKAVAVYSLSGVRLKSVIAHRGSTSADVALPANSGEVVIVQVGKKGTNGSGSMLVRLK